MSRVVVCGSLNMDVVVESMRRPNAGETSTETRRLWVEINGSIGPTNFLIAHLTTYFL